MNSAAVVIGIDDYATKPLTTSVRDALAFRQSLIDLHLVPQAKIHLLTSPQGPDANGSANSQEIIKAIDYFYRDGSNIERFFFYFAGHGILAYSNAAHNRVRTVVIPADVVDIDRNGKLLIDFDELVELYSQTGPQQQMFFIDACRDMPYDKLPNVTELGLAGVPVGAHRRQAALFAVSPFGEAVATRDGTGRFTDYLLRSLRKETGAFDFDAERDKYVITMQSVYAYAHDGVAREIASDPLASQLVRVPQLKGGQPAPDPILEFDNIDARPLTVHIDPNEAADQTNVKLFLNRSELDRKYCYPLNINHSTVRLQPQRHLVLATSTAGQPEPARALIDPRKQSEHTIYILPPPTPDKPFVPGPGGDAIPIPIPFPLPPKLEQSIVASGAEGQVEATALEQQVAVTLSGLNFPYPQWSANGRLTSSRSNPAAAKPFRTPEASVCAPISAQRHSFSHRRSAAAAPGYSNSAPRRRPGAKTAMVFDTPPTPSAPFTRSVFPGRHPSQ